MLEQDLWNKMHEENERAREHIIWWNQKQDAQRQRDERWILFLNRFEAIIITAIAAINIALAIGVINFGYIIEYFILYSPDLLKLFTILGTLILFSMRGYIPIGYGCLEITVGIAAILSTPNAASSNIPAALPLLSGAYIVVRGLDNIAKGLSPNSFLGRYFSLLFNNPKKNG